MRNNKFMRLTALFLIVTCACSLLISCKKGGDDGKTARSGHSVTIEVNTMYAGDEYGEIFYDAVAKWESETGYTVKTVSNTSDEAYKKLK